MFLPQSKDMIFKPTINSESSLQLRACVLPQKTLAAYPDYGFIHALCSEGWRGLDGLMFFLKGLCEISTGMMLEIATSCEDGDVMIRIFFVGLKWNCPQRESRRGPCIQILGE